ncbi:MAG: hypothetical protein GY909_16085 [Oligoflexia bacterium]|nr:hypothetical protein [Oligoflexia bacterium]
MRSINDDSPYEIAQVFKISRRIDINIFSNNSELQDYCESLANQTNLRTKKIIINHLMCIFENFILTEYKPLSVSLKSGKLFGLPYRYNSRKINGMSVKKVIEILEERGLITVYKGFRGLTKSRLTRIVANNTLINELNNIDLKSYEIGVHPLREVIILKDEDKKYIDYKETTQSRRLRREVGSINSYLKKHSITIDGKNVECSFRRIFNHGSFSKGGRIYANYQNIKKEDRRKLLINGEKTVELDYSGLHINMLYLKVTGDIYQDGDVYHVKGFEKYRKIFKIALQICFNAKNESSAIKAVRSHLIDLGLTDKICPKKLIRAFEKKHELVRHLFYTQIGLDLQYIDSQMALYILKEAKKRKVVALTIHDSFIASHNLEDWLIKKMNEASMKYLGGIVPIEAK